MALPTFYILGAQKCGTTWLASMLRQHPQIFIPRRKEVHFFNVAENYARGRVWFESHFSLCDRAVAIGDATPDYLAVTWTEESAKVIPRIHALTPDAKFIVCVRDPVTRAVSALLHHIRAGRLSPWVDLDVQFDLILSGRQPTHGVLEFGRYGRQVSLFLCQFPIDRFRFLVYEQDIVRNKRETLRDVCRFLDVQTDFDFRRLDVLRNPSLQTRMGLVLAQFYPFPRGMRLVWWAERLRGGKLLSISDDTARRLYRYYQSDTAELTAIIGRNLDKWWFKGAGDADK